MAMTDTAFLASRTGPLPGWFEATVAALGYEPAATLTVDRPEHGRYNLPPGLVDRVARRLGETDAAFLGVDELLHPGQRVDLEAALPPVTVRDRRGVVWRRLAAANPVAERSLALRDARVERRRVAGAERDSNRQSPGGSGDRVGELDRRCQQLRADLETLRTEARERVTDAHGGVDARVVLVGPPTALSTALRTALTDNDATGDPFGPARPTTTVTTIGPHKVALTDTPGLVAELPDWYTGVVPGTLAALEDASAAVVVGERHDPLERCCRAVEDRVDGPLVPVLPGADSPVAGLDPVDGATPGAVRSRLAAVLPSSRLALSLPYGDETHALVSRLHDQVTVHTVEYGETVLLDVEVPAGRVDRLRRRVGELGGESEPQPPAGR
jgi:50S ribosomal subunit-associated GTPase HflX